jgi:hypothetical protein
LRRGDHVNTSNYNPPADDDDDLPMTVRRARQERASQLGAASSPPIGPTPTPAQLGHAASPPLGTEPYAHEPGYAAEPYDDRVTVTRFDVPFFRLMTFFLKAVLAAIPALILLGAILYAAGVILRVYFPWIVQTQIVITFPN